MSENTTTPAAPAPTVLRLTQSFESVVSISADGKQYLFEQVKAVHEALNAPVVDPTLHLPAGLVASAQKIALDPAMSDEAKLTIILGEVIGNILSEEFAKEAYPAVFGISARIKNVSYQETPTKLPPPDDAVPVVVQKGDRNKP